VASDRLVIGSTVDTAGNSCCRPVPVMAIADVNRIEYLGGALGMFIAFISICCSFSTLFLIRSIGRWNGFISLVWSMTISQIIYDITFVLIFPSEVLFYSNIFVSTFGGTSVTFWTNVMSGVVLYMVFTRTPVDTFKYYWTFFFCCVVLPLVYATVSDIYVQQYLDQLDFSYNIIRLASIGLNFISYFLVWWKLRQYSKSGVLSPDHPLLFLASRLKYYPIVQVITRVWPSIYEFKYGNSLAHAAYNTTTPSSDAEFLFYTIFLPSAGIGYFLVFLKVQPLAYELFMRRCCCQRRRPSQDNFNQSLTSYQDPYLTNNDSFGSNLSGGAHSVAGTLTPFCARSEMDEEQLLNEFHKEHRSHHGGKSRGTSADNPNIQL
jgi:hypothetical protein